MRLKTFIALFASLAVVGSIPMDFRKEVPADEVIVPKSESENDRIAYRLPNNTIPISYDITLTTDVHIGKADFTGKVVINIIAKEDNSKSITLHHRQITIDSVELYPTANPDDKINITYASEDDTEFLVITLTERNLVANSNYTVGISYQGLLRDDNMGFYRSSYKNAEGQTVWLATTQFEQTDARHAFPCYDEPQIRASHTIHIKHDKSYKAISNMEENDPVRENDGSDYVITSFPATEPVQTYLVAFIISDFGFLEGTGGERNIPQRVFAKNQSITNGDAEFALKAGIDILDQFEKHLGVNYKLPKMDQVAVPDFDAGAMENWGLVTYREEYLLYNKNIATTRQRENILTIIAHEYAHQWFGNFVSPKWWSYLWLNEGFATLYENYLASLVYPEDRLMDTFVIDTVQSVLDVDANPAIRPMTFYVEDPESISSLFDRVAYDKSGSVLRMMQVALNVDTWTKGIKNYLISNELESASSNELYIGLQTAVDEDYPQLSKEERPNVEEIMSTWETQSGYPVIHVSRVENGSLHFEQQRFFYTNDTSNNLWIVPINFVTANNPNFSETKPDFWLPASKTTYMLSSSSSKKWNNDDWIVANVQQSGYYRVNYDEKLWNLLISQLNSEKHDVIHVLNRAQLIDDSINLARAGKIAYEIPFGILKYLEDETDYIPWAAANRGMTLLNRWLSGTSAYIKYQAFVRQIVEPLYNKLGVNIINDTEHKLDRYARSIAINLACQAGLAKCLNETSEQLKKLMNEDVQIAPDVQSAIYCNGLRDADASVYFHLQNRMLTSEDQAERTLIISALGCSKDEIILTQLLNLAIAPGNALRLQEKFRVFASPVNNGELGLRVTMNFIRQNYNAIINVASSQISTMIANIASRVSSQTVNEEFDSLLTFLQQLDLITEQHGNSLKATARSNLDWQKNYLEQIEKFFDGPATQAAPASVVASTILIIFCALSKTLL